MVKFGKNYLITQSKTDVKMHLIRFCCKMAKAVSAYEMALELKGSKIKKVWKQVYIM